MTVLTLEKTDREQLISLALEKGVYLEGNLLKILGDDGDTEFRKYLDEAISRDREIRKKRLEVTKQIQAQNKELQDAEAENAKLMSELREALDKTENAKKTIESDLDLLQKKTQFELMSRIVKVALGLVIGVGLTTTALYTIAIFTGRETALIGNTWSSMFGILLTNSFSIIGTIMGVKYASEGKSSSQN
jgi:hypothetical protein